MRRRMIAALWRVTVGLHPPTPPARPLTGVAAVSAIIASTHVLGLGFAFGPSRRPPIPPVIRPLRLLHGEQRPHEHRRPAPPREPNIGRGIWDTRGDLPR